MQKQTIQIGVGSIIALALALITADAVGDLVQDMIFGIGNFMARYVPPLVSGILEFVMLLFWAVIAVVLLVVVAMRSSKNAAGD